MRKGFLFCSILVACSAFGQSSTDIFTLSESQLRGTARYMSMAGAFGALGGDISTLTQNPAGIGVYRSSDISVTLDIDPQRTTLQNTGSGTYTDKQTRVACNNFGYIGAVSLGNSVMPYFQWGASYNRVNTFDRYYRGYFPTMNTSWTNFVADFTNSVGYSQKELFGESSYDPFFSSDADWLSILSYNTMLINPNSNMGKPGEPAYLGLYKNGTSTGNAETEVRERGYIDEYSINFGGNFADMVYWGIGFGIRDLSFTRSMNYNEQISNAWVPVNPTNSDDLGYGAAEWSIDSYQRTTGTGFNIKFGLIFKPINEFRIGVAVHTPTWYNLNFQQNAQVVYGLGEFDETSGYYTYDNYPGGDDNPYAETGNGYWSQSLKTPWRLMASAAGVIGGRFILSADYVYEAYPSMCTTGDDPEVEEIAADVKQYYKGSNELRVGAEVRVTPKFSVRAGYGYKSSAATSEAYNNEEYIYTSGVSTMYTFAGDRHNLTLGIGYKFGQFSIDAAYVHTTQNSSWSAYSAFPRQEKQAYALTNAAYHGPTTELHETHNRFALTLGFRF